MIRASLIALGALALASCGAETKTDAAAPCAISDTYDFSAVTFHVEAKMLTPSPNGLCENVVVTIDVTNEAGRVLHLDTFPLASIAIHGGPYTQESFEDDLFKSSMPYTQHKESFPDYTPDTFEWGTTLTPVSLGASKAQYDVFLENAEEVICYAPNSSHFTCLAVDAEGQGANVIMRAY